jgi:ABC-type sulfate/molybdate transport systems ATPase subunit/ABC-type sulfate transport system permease component
MRARVSSPLPWLGGLLALYLLVPIVAFVVRLAGGAPASPGLGSALATSLVTATIATVVIIVLGTPLAYMLARRRGVVGRVLLALVALPLALPTLMSGILLLYVVGPFTIPGELFGGKLTDTRAGIVLAQIFVAAPFMIIAARAAFLAVDPALEEVAATLGHGRVARFARVAVPAALPGIAAGILLTWLRAFAEFGATVILAYHPFSLPVFTFVQFDEIGLPGTMLPIAAALLAALVVLLLAQLPIPRRRRGRVRTASFVPVIPDSPATLDFGFSKRLGSFALEIAHSARSPRLALLGPSGAGKTLTLRLLAGLTAGESGHVRVGPRALDELPTEHRQIAYVPQQPALLPRRTVWQQATFGVGAKPELASWWLEQLGLEGLENRYPEELSGGQQRRVSLARALAVEPSVLLLDEPFTGLDAPVADRLRRELRRLQRETGMCSVIVTHDPEEAALLADEIIVLDQGSVLQAGTRAQVFEAPSSPEVAGLLGIANAHRGVAVSGGAVRSAGTEIQTSADGLAEGSGVVWCVRPERILVDPAGGYGAVLLDDIDLGCTRELTVSLTGGLELTLRTAARTELRIGERLRLEIPAEDIVLWPLPGSQRDDGGTGDSLLPRAG